MRGKSEDLWDSKFLENFCNILSIEYVDEHNVDVERLSVFGLELIVQLDAIKSQQLSIFAFNANSVLSVEDL